MCILYTHDEKIYDFNTYDYFLFLQLELNCNIVVRNVKYWALAH